MKPKIILIIFSIATLSTTAQINNPTKTLRGHEFTVLCLDVDKTGQYLVSGSYDKQLILWDVKTGEQLNAFKGHNAGVWDVKISPDGKFVASGSWNNNINAKGSSLNCLNIYDLKSHKLIKRLSIEPDSYKTFRFIPELDGMAANGIYQILFHPNANKMAAITRAGALFIWDIKSGFNQTIYDFSTTSHELINLSPDWNYVVCCERKRIMIDSSFYLMKLGTNKIIAKFDNPKRSVVGVYFSSNSKYIASISGDRIKRNEIDIWDFKTQKLKFILKGHSNVIRSIAFSPDDKFLASAGEDNLINLWKLETGELIISFSENNHKELTSVLFTPDQKYLISASQDKTIKYWNIEKWI